MGTLKDVEKATPTERAMDEGYASYCAGMGLEQNPYGEGTLFYECWKQGWLNGAGEDDFHWDGDQGALL